MKVAKLEKFHLRARNQDPGEPGVGKVRGEGFFFPSSRGGDWPWMTLWSFLDVSITRVGNKLQTSLFCKKKLSSVYVNFDSNLPNTNKKGLIDTSNFSSIHHRINYLKKLLGRGICFCYFLPTNVFKSFLISYSFSTITNI